MTWTTVRFQREATSHPDRDAQARTEARAARERWDRMVAQLPYARAFLTRADAALPEVLAAEAQAVAAVERARWRLLERVVREQGGQAVEVDGLPAVAMDPADTSPELAAAEAELLRVREGLSHLRTKRAEAEAVLAAYAHAAPPPAVG